MAGEELARKANIVIIGGGIAGCTAAYVFAKQGIKDVVLIEKKELSSEASGANFANVMMTMLPLRPALLPLYDATLNVMEGLSEELGRDVEYRPPRLNTISDEDYEKVQAMVDELHERGYHRARIISKEEFREMEPNLNLTSRAFLDERGGLINPLYMTTAFGDKAAELGVTIYENTRVTDIKTEGGRAKSVVTDKGEIEANYILNCSGAWGSQISEMIGLKVPIDTLKCQAMVCEVVAPEWFIYNSVSRSEYLFADMAHDNDGVSVFGLYRQAKKGNLLLAITEEPGNDKWVTYEAMEAIAQNAVKELPMVKEKNVHIISSYGNCYAITPDRHAIIGPVDGCENFFMNCGYADYGMGTAYGTAEILADMIINGKKEFPIEELRASRFGKCS